ncbi:enoyl-CoA hydratase/isomerase family protein [Falsiroseomonas bella]|uniref:Enoyl-CoA hydratase/isomerase family protein n=1 Tax=Falsiroseomonas bella TaxID=2184016 RepID=A0A317FDI0_9PROT|nr:enoyl-CoA hydratase/isomerase family protein [Falsiroseomonas bella]PWS36432.1 enoyl-CoA hydratase/isomerase family protein [Falsiroseomonas bella]
MGSQFETVLCEALDGVGTITLNRPDQRNALNLQMALDLHAAVKALEADGSVRVILVRGAGPTFCAGADMKERAGVTEEWLRNRRLAAFAAYDAIQYCPKPCIAVGHGPIIGSGCEIATACDFILASSRVSFRYPEAVRGSVGATQRLPRIVGKALAKELLFTGRVMGAEEALRVGLMNRVVAPEDLEAAVKETVGMILQAFPLSVQLAKRCIDVGMESDLRTGQAYEMLAIDRCLADGEWRRGAAAFTAGKPPR